MNPAANAVFAAIACLCTLRTAAAQDEPRYSAVLANGRRIAGMDVSDWGFAGGTPKLDGQPLMHPENPVRWLRDNTLSVTRPPEAFVEFISGDRLPGTPLRACNDRQQVAGVDVPAHLVVKPGVILKDSNNNDLSEVRVDVRMIRRIVWRRLGAERHRPGSLFGRDGRKIAFRGHRFLPGAVRLLTESGIENVAFEDVAELHLPQADPWEAYFHELAALSPDLNARLFQIETVTGLIATSSTMRFMVPNYGEAPNPNTWHHLIQPAWSLDAFAVGHREIHMRRYFAPHEVPLSRIAPVWAENRSAVHSGWRWQVNRNVHRRPLQSGKHACGWGFGVHGFSELKFPLPAAAVAFRTRLKLDAAVGDGGCVCAVVTLSAGSRQQDAGSYKTLQQLYRSETLIGSTTVLETGDLPLPAPGQNRARLLTLAVDPLNLGHPKHADPLDIRDTLNWHEPVVLLERKALAAEVRRRSIRAITPWNDWVLQPPDEVPLRLVGRWDARPARGVNYRFGVLPERPPLTLWRTMTVAPEQKWLIISAGVPDEQTPPSLIEVRVDGETLAQYQVPVRLSGAEEPSPLAVSLDSLAGREVKLEIVQRSLNKGAANGVVDWRAIVFAGRLPILREVFEDRAAFVPLLDQGEPKATAEPLSEGAYSGNACVKITPGGQVKIDLGGQATAIRGLPNWDEYRYIRFAFRKRGRGHVGLELEHDGPPERKLRYFAGRGQSPAEGAQRDVTVVLADGREVKGRTLGVDRANDAAMVKITDEGEYPFVEIAGGAKDLHGELLLGVAHPPEFQAGGQPAVHLTWVRGEINALLWTTFSPPIVGSGGPLLIATQGAADEGKLVGVHSSYAWGGFLYTPVARYRESWDRLKQGQAWGQWGPGAGPLLGIYSSDADAACKISQLVPGGPAQKAKLLPGDLIKSIDDQNLASRDDLGAILSKKDPGQEVQLQVERGGKALDVKLILGGRK